MDKVEVEENSETNIFNNESESATRNDVNSEKDTETDIKESEQTMKEEVHINQES